MEKKKNKRRYMIGVAFFLVGLCAIGFPFAKAWYNDYRQAKLLSEWQHNALLSSPLGETIAKDFKPAPIGEAGDVLPVKKLTTDGVLEEDTSPSYSDAYIMANMVGTITIDSIKLKSIILKGSSPNNLDIGICEVTGTAGMGDIGNYVLAGHKSRIYGRHFNRLSQVKIGDAVKVSNGASNYTYKVTEILRVTADDTWIMDDSAERTITLITCDYTQTPIGRLAVRGALVW